MYSLLIKVTNADQTAKPCDKESSGDGEPCSQHQYESEDDDFDDTYKIVNNVRISDPFFASNFRPLPAGSPSSVPVATIPKFAFPARNKVILGQ